MKLIGCSIDCPVCKKRNECEIVEETNGARFPKNCLHCNNKLVYTSVTPLTVLARLEYKEDEEWETKNERVVKWDKEQTAYLLKRLGKK